MSAPLLHSANAIRVLLHYYSSDGNYEGIEATTYLLDLHRGLEAAGLLKNISTGTVPIWKPTEALNVYVKHLLSIPFPIKIVRWEIPSA